MKQRIYQIIEKAEEGDRASKVFDNTILVLIVLTIVAIILESYDSLYSRFEMQFEAFEAVSVTIFTVEYLLRIWTSDIKYKGKKRLLATLTYMVTFMALIDLFAILPFYLPMLIPYDLRFLRMLRITRLARVLKLNRYSKAMNLIVSVVKEKKEELIATVSIMLLIMVMSSTLIYYIESEVQPEAFPNIVASFWWAVATLTTVGYGDVYPITAAGKVLSSIIAIAGIGLVALPTGILSSGFMQGISKSKIVKCPHCKKKIEIDQE